MRTANVSEVPVSTQVRRRGLGSLIGDVIRRFQNADGTSHTRALGYQGTFAMMSGFIGLIGLASVLGIDTLRATMQWSSPVRRGARLVSLASRS